MSVNKKIKSDASDSMLLLLSNSISLTTFDQLYQNPAFNYLFEKSSSVVLVYHFTSRSFKFISKNFSLLTGYSPGGWEKLSIIEFTNELFEENNAFLLNKIIYPKILNYYKKYTHQGNVKNLKIVITARLKSESIGWIMLQMGILEIDKNGYPTSSVMLMSKITELKSNNLIDLAVYEMECSQKNYKLLYSVAYPSDKKLYGLSPREYEIAFYLKEGKTSKQIASILQLSTHTVDTHRRRILKKTGTCNTADLVHTVIKKEREKI